MNRKGYGGQIKYQHVNVSVIDLYIIDFIPYHPRVTLIVITREENK
jgi:hypothetical protein